MNSRYMLSFILLVLTSSVPALAMEQRQRGALRRPLLAEEMVGLSADSAADAADISGQEGASVVGSADDGAVVVPDAASRQLEAQTPATSKKGFLSRCFGSIGNCCASCKNGCASAARKCARLAGLLTIEGINCGLWGIEESGRGSAPLFYSLVTGKGANEITRTWHGAYRLTSLIAALGGWAFFNYYCGVDIDMVRNSSIMWAVDLFFDGYSKLRGRENDFSNRFRRWPQKAQQLFIAGVKKLMTEIETHADQAQIEDEDFDAVV